MRGILRVGLMVLLAAVASVGIARGQVKGEYTDRNGVTWEYEEIVAGTTCSIGPKDRNSISGFVKIPEKAEGIKVVSIRETAFWGCSGLTAVDIPSSVTVIGASAFWDCSGLTAVTIQGSVTVIGSSAFHGCSSLTAVTIPGSVTKIGGGAFSGCSSLTAVDIPCSVTEIGNGAFSGCSGLKSFEVESENKNYCAAGGVLFTKDIATLICYPGGKAEESYTIPGSVTEIGENAFNGCSGLTAVDIPSSVTKIGETAFNGCSGLKAVDIPSSVTEIGERAFAWCSGLIAVTIPSSVTKIGEGAFVWCSGLKSFEVESGNKNYCAAGGVLFTKDKATLICYPGGKAEESYTIPGSVTEIGDYAFAGFDGLTSVTIPSSVTEIGWYAFSGCSGLNAVYWLAKANCRVGGDVFTRIASPATLYVRQGEKAAIKGNGKTWWSKFTIMEGYVVTFKDSDGNKLGEQLVKPNNGTATAPTAPTREGYTFVEWQRDGKKYDFSKKVEKDITLVAVWKKADHQGTAVESVQLAAVRVVRNPVGEVLELEGMERAARVEVYSVVGARVHAEALRGEPRVAIDARGWGSGVYVVRVVASDGARTLRVVK